MSREASRWSGCAVMMRTAAGVSKTAANSTDVKITPRVLDPDIGTAFKMVFSDG